ncbi:MAG: glycosyltransferase [Acidobacteriota bacterium]|nr:glycosyltransferase [Acidobacteriota bacterium]
MTTVAEPIGLLSSFRKNGPLGNWIHAISHLDPQYGGLSSAVPALSSAIARTGKASITLAGFCQAGEHYLPAVGDGVAVDYFPLSRVAWLKNSERRSSFRNLVARSSGVHIHGLWQMSTSAGAKAAQSAGKPYLISAHGMLESWAIANKRIKKQIYAALFERANLRSAACLHALTEAEARDYRNFGLKNPIAVIPNGVDVPERASATLFLERFPELRGKRIVLFLGRIHFKKGLDLLAEAWSRLSRDWPDAQLVLAGPDFENTQLQVEKRLADLGIRHRVTFTGMLGRDLKWSALAAADCFVLPSYSEGLSVSVLEAMAIGIPVIITKQCNLPEVELYECGWAIQPEAAELTSALDGLLRSTAAERSSFGKNGRRLVAERYSWPVIGEQMRDVYSWLTGGPLPTAVNFHGKVNS